MIELSRNSDEEQGTIHLSRLQIFTIFHPYPLPLAFQQNAYEGDFDPYVLWPFDHPHMGTPLPPKTCWRLKWMVPYVLVRIILNNVVYRVDQFFPTCRVAGRISEFQRPVNSEGARGQGGRRCIWQILVSSISTGASLCPPQYHITQGFSDLPTALFRGTI